jgi:hypothetical protein
MYIYRLNPKTTFHLTSKQFSQPYFFMSNIFSEGPKHFPVVSGNDLNGKSWKAPVNFPAERTLVVVAFEREQQANVDAWFEGLGAKDAASLIPWIEMPVIENPGIFVRWFINSGMRGGIPDIHVRSHVWTAYTDKKKFMTACGMASSEHVYAMVVDREGRIPAMESGDYSKEGADRLLGVLNL